MIVDQVHVHSLAVIEAEHHTPVARDADAPLACAITLEGMQPETGRVGTTRMRRLLQAKQDTTKPWHETGREPRRVVALVQRPQCLVPDP